jgi:hypothetical protein
MSSLDEAIASARTLLSQAQGPAHTLAEDLCMRVNAQSDRSLLPHVLRTFFDGVDDASLVATLALMHAKGRSGQARYRRVSMELALNSQLFAELAYQRIEDLHAIAVGVDLPQVSALFLSSPYDPRGPLAEESGPENPYLEISLGRRKAAARNTRFTSANRDTLDRLLRDRNPAVIRLILQNGRVVEGDVVRMAAQRPANPQCLQCIAEHPKWAQRYAVRKALACNPRTPHPVAERLMRTLMRQDLRFIAGTSNLSERVRIEAQRALDESAGAPPKRKKPAAILRGRLFSELEKP